MPTLDNTTTGLRDSLLRFIDSFIHYLPNLVAALVILVAGWLAAYLARWVVLRFGTGLDALLAAIYRRMGRTRSSRTGTSPA